MSEYGANTYYFDVLLQFDKEDKNRQVTEEYVLNNITYGLKTLFGEVGAAFPINVIQFSPPNAQHISKNQLRLILTCPAECAVKVRASLTLHGSYQGERCAYHILKAANSLLSLT